MTSPAFSQLAIAIWCSPWGMAMRPGSFSLSLFTRKNSIPPPRLLRPCAVGQLGGNIDGYGRQQQVAKDICAVFNSVSFIASSFKGENLAAAALGKKRIAIKGLLPPDQEW
ncbi:hypothetical protein [Microbulbifer halophilus]|uniref:Uncharacterized protein n=1 Tax=Microbulbifer halophilus TaxID=453963 RepID=A0ABW5EB42_9GAMM|nr:hypothetical protein [Microbulbifer halophilus]MCW8127272.1 hypothetical protein [Microbulbifer halophilus]